MSLDYYPKLYMRTHANAELSTETFPLAFVTPYEDTAAGRKRQSSVDTWANHREYDYVNHVYKDKEVPEAHQIDNSPQTGFTFGKVISRYSTSNKFVEVYDPRGFKLQLDIANVVYLLQNATIKDGAVQEPLMWARAGGNFLALESDVSHIKSKTTGGLSVGDKINVAGVDYVFFGKLFVTAMAAQKEPVYDPNGPTPAKDRWGYWSHGRPEPVSYNNKLEFFPLSDKKVWVLYDEATKKFTIYKSAPKHTKLSSGQPLPVIANGDLVEGVHENGYTYSRGTTYGHLFSTEKEFTRPSAETVKNFLEVNVPQYRRGRNEKPNYYVYDGLTFQLTAK